MERFSLRLLLIAAIVFLNGCYTVSTTYDGDNLYTVTAVSDNEVEANNLVMNKAVKICSFRPYLVDVVEHTSGYYGMSAAEKDLVAKAHQEVGASAKTKSKNDYKAVLHFRCKKAMNSARPDTGSKY